jgi:D-glycero-alpha-D-manno-heptose-7-phosphate kinase
VGLIKALTALRGRMLSKPELARQAIQLEQVGLKEHVGCQDAVAAAHGGLNVIHFPPDGDIRVTPVTIPPARVAELSGRLLLFYLGSSRLASAIAGDVVAGLKSRSDDLRHMRRMVDEGLAILSDGGDLDDFGRLLGDGWMRKRRLSRAVSTEAVDRVYQTALDHGAIGGKLLGAGGTGFMLFYVPPDRQAEVVASLPACVHVPFQFESEGSSIIYYAPDASLSTLERALQTA